MVLNHKQNCNHNSKMTKNCNNKQNRKETAKMALRFAGFGFDAVAVFVAVFSFSHFHRNRNRSRNRNRKPQTANRVSEYGQKQHFDSRGLLTLRKRDGTTKKNMVQKIKIFKFTSHFINICSKANNEKIDYFYILLY